MTKRTFLAVGLAIMSIASLVAQNGLTGIWYSTWYVREGAYIWHSGHGSGSQQQFLADVNGDGKDDAVVYFSSMSSGSWYVALSNGDGFNNYSVWKTGFGSGSLSQMLADVNGDGKADAITYSSGGEWKVAYSSGSSFGTASTWKSGHGDGSKTRFAADVNGDGKADAIAFFDVSGFAGKWYVALSGGGTSCWQQGHGSGSKKQFVGDVNGDGKADAVVFFDNNDLAGNWYVALSSGSSFGGYSAWISGHGAGSTLQTLGDTNNDGKADAVIFISDGQWYTATSTGSKFNSYSKWKSEHGAGATATAIMVGNPIGGDSNAAITYQNGLWNVLPSSYSRPIFWNLWDAWDIKYLPYSQGKYQQYDSGDPATIQEHLKELSEAKIDYLLMDETNNLYVENGIIFNRAIAVAKEIKKWNENPANRPIRYAFAIGGIQFSGSPSTLENEAKEVWNNVINRDGTGGLDTYLMQDGKPLLVCYYGQESYRTAWEAVDHTWSDKFTIRWCNGVNNSTPDLYGWGIPNGSINSSFLMEVMPGWNNHLGQFVSRNGGSFYSTYCWNRVLSKLPEQVIINSYNEYAEETAVAKTSTSNLTGNSEKWGSADMYWNSTVDYVAQYKNKKNCGTPTVNFTVDKTQSDEPADFTFTNQTANGINYQWDFGDGAYSIEPNPVHHYAVEGKYTVTLRATGTGATAVNTKTDYITVGSTTRADKIIAENAVKLYLAGDLLCIDSDLDVKSVSIYDAQGRLIAEIAVADNVAPLGSLDSGMYIAVINAGADTIARKILKR